MKFWKLHGAGNDFIVIDDRVQAVFDCGNLAKAVCHRHFGVGADGLMLVRDSRSADVKMLYFNSDGSRGSMCGNGIRCFSKFARDTGAVSGDIFTVETDDGIKEVRIELIDVMRSLVGVGMGSPGPMELMELFAPETGCGISAVHMHMGVPHTVIFIDDMDPLYLKRSGILVDMGDETLEDGIYRSPLADALTENWGPALEKDPRFPEGSNINFVKRRKHLSPEEPDLLVSTWERGAGRTLACGTGVCASALAARSFHGFPSEMVVGVPGGRLTISITDGSAKEAGGTVYMQGEACFVCSGEFPW